MWSSLKNYSDAVLLTLRIALGSLCFYLHGWPALAGGVKRWTAMGANMKHLGISLAPTMWGFLAASAESVGCLLLIIGFAFRPTCLWLLLCLVVLTLVEYKGGLARAEHSLQLALFLLAFLFIGPGKFSVDKG